MTTSPSTTSREIPSEHLPSGFQVGWIFSAWAMAFVATALVSAIAVVAVTALLALGSSEFAFDSSLIAIIGAGVAFGAFFAVLQSRLLQLQEMRFAHAVSLGVVQAIFAVIVVGIMFIVQAATSYEIGDLVRGSLIALFLAGATGFIAGMMATAILPGRGNPPEGTQRTHSEPADTL